MSTRGKVVCVIIIIIIILNSRDALCTLGCLLIVDCWVNPRYAIFVNTSYCELAVAGDAFDGEVFAEDAHGLE